MNKHSCWKLAFFCRGRGQAHINRCHLLGEPDLGRVSADNSRHHPWDPQGEGHLLAQLGGGLLEGKEDGRGVVNQDLPGWAVSKSRAGDPF